MVYLQAHFEDSQFLLNRADGRRLLKWNAIPTVFNVPNKPKLVTLKRRNPLEKKNDNVLLTDKLLQPGCEDGRPPIKKPLLSNNSDHSYVKSASAASAYGLPTINRHHGDHKYSATFPADCLKFGKILHSNIYCFRQNE